MPKKLDRCVKKVMNKNRKLPKSKRVNPYAVCKASIYGKNKSRRR